MSLSYTKIDVEEEFHPQVPQAHRRWTSNGWDNSNGCLSYYNKLPEEPLQLSVLRLDGSSFDIEVMRSATVAELKEAVEDVFSHMPRKGPGKISWSHVWGHFCLCYGGQKLVEDSDNIRNYGIKDGDQIEFIRHVSNKCYSPSKRRSLKRTTTQEKQRISISQLSRYRDEKDGSFDDIEDGRHRRLDEICYSMDEEDDSMVSQLFKRWLPYSRLPTIERIGSLTNSPPRSTCGFFDNFKMMMLFCGGNQHPPRDAWRED